MDNLGWSTIEGRFGVSNPNILCPTAVNNDLAEGIFNPIQELQRTSPENVVSNLNSSQCQDTRLAADWEEEAITSAEFCSPPLNLLTGSMAEFVNGFQDCMLSAPNSNTDISVDDDEISMIFRNKEMKCPVNHELDETVSQNSSECYVLNNEKFQENRPEGKKPRLDNPPKTSSSINFQIQQSGSSASSSMEEPDPEAMAQMKEMIYRAAAFRPVNLSLEMVENYKPKMRKNVRISSDPQTVAARQRRERISERIRVLQRLVPGGNKMDTATMLDEAASYLKFLRSQVKALENLGHNLDCPPVTTSFGFYSLPFHHSFPMQTHFPLVQNPNHTHHPQC